MRLPYTPANLIMWLDPSERYVNKDQNGNVLSVINRVNGRPIIQTNPALQPTWSATSFNGTPGITFNGSQYLSHNEIAPLCAGNKTPITVVQAAIQPSSGFGFPIGISNSVVAGFSFFESVFSTAFTGHDFVVTYSDDLHLAGTGTVLYSPTNLFGMPIVYTAAYDNNISLRINGNLIGTTPNPKGQLTTDSCLIGAVNANGAVRFGLVGTVGPTLVYLGTPGVADAEYAIMAACNMI